MFASAEGLGQLLPITAPSGQEVSLTPEEERTVVKEAISDKIRSGLTMGTDIRKSAIGALGNAIGFAVGGFLAAWFRGKK